MWELEHDDGDPSLLLTMLNEWRAGGEDVNECLEWWRAEVSVGPERQR